MRSKWSLLLWGTSIFALPQDPHIMSGDALMTISSPEVLEIVAQDGTTIEWRSFSIDTSEIARFSQPSSEALVLNRVVGSEMSQIFGKLESNGCVLLINPNGILFGKEARVDTGSFIASTLDLQSDLFAKNKVFKGSSTAQIINLGSLNAHQKSLSLIASDIDQQGCLNASSVALIGSNYTQDFECQFQNSSRITHSGTLNSPAGCIHLMADEIFIFGTSEISTSSPYDGGEILIGAGLQGKDSSFTNAQIVWVDQGARFSADSWELGNGGGVILYSDHMTDFAGYISAQGGKRGGDGGFAEVSGAALTYRGLANLGSPLDQTGTLLLDPVDITIGPVTAGNIVLIPALFPLNCGVAAVVPPIRQNQPTPGPTATIDVATLAAQIGLPANVIIDSTGAGAGTGNITWIAGAPFIYTSANDLVLRAPAGATVTINSDVQNAGTGRAIIEVLPGAASTVNIAPAAPPGVSFGSSDGLTEICAPNATVNVRGAAGFAQVGFRTPNAGTSTGPISIICNALNADSLSSDLFVQIGHGTPLAVGFETHTTSTATITVSATNNISMTVSGGGGITKIGHGSRGSTALTTLAGDITLTSLRGSLIMQEIGSGFIPVIGHGSSAGTAASISGDIRIFTPSANGDVQMLWNTTSASARIGHQLPGPLGMLDGDIEICCGRDVIMSGTGGFTTNQIAHGIGNLIMPYVGTTRITAANDFRIIETSGLTVGGPSSVGINVNGPIDHSTQIVVGRDFIADMDGAGVLIGANTSHPAARTSLMIAAGRDVLLNGFTGLGVGIVAIANDLVAISAGRDFRARAADMGIVVGASNSNFIIPTTCIHAGRDLIGINGPLDNVVLGEGLTVFPNYFVDFRAGRDIQIPNSLLSAGTGGIFVEADSNFLAGDLWSYAGGTIDTICGFSLTSPTPFQNFPPYPIPCNLLLAGQPTGASSLALSLDCFGAVRFVPSFNGTIPLFQTTTGPITIHSGSEGANGIQDLSIGPNAGDNLRLATTSGNIEIFGTAIPGQCQRCDAFRNITINQPIVTTGNPSGTLAVLICANNDLTLTALGSINTSGGPSAVTLICDNQANFRPLIGPGRFIMDSAAFINTGGAPLQIYTALQGANIWGVGARLNNLAFGTDWTLGTLFVDTNQELWCTYYCAGIDVGSPFRISYKDCLQLLIQQAMIIVDQFLVDLHPYNEFPGWMMRFWIDYALVQTEYTIAYDPEPYMLSRRHLNIINHPKTWTEQNEDTNPRPVAD